MMVYSSVTRRVLDIHFLYCRPPNLNLVCFGSRFSNRVWSGIRHNCYWYVRPHFPNVAHMDVTILTR